MEVLARNSHAMTILDCPNSTGKLLVIYGGASPERGTLGDTVYALLPEDPNTIGEPDSQTDQGVAEYTQDQCLEKS